MANPLHYRLVRRIITLPLTLLATAVAVLTLPITVIVGLILGVIARSREFLRVRLVLLLTGGLLIETAGIVASLWKWIRTGFGLAGTDHWRWHQHRRYLGRYTAASLALISRVLATPIVWREGAAITGNTVVLARHTSFFDALLPATLAAHRNDILPHHVLTRGLTYAPCIDLCGHRFPIHFVTRGSHRAGTDLAPIERLGAHVNDTSTAIIFPEGTFRTPARHERAVQRLAERSPDLAARAARLQHVLPPRTAGVYALLQGAADADVIVCANTGFERFDTLRAIAARPLADRPIVIETWRIDRSEVPTDPTAFADWLLGVYEDIDRWVTAVQAEND